MCCSFRSGDTPDNSKAPRRIRTRGCSWYHLISQHALPLYAAPTSDSSVTGLPGDLYSRAGFKISAPKLLPHPRLRTDLAAVNQSLWRSVETYSSSSVPLCYEYVLTLPQGAGFVKRKMSIFRPRVPRIPTPAIGRSILRPTGIRSADTPGTVNARELTASGRIFRAVRFIVRIAAVRVRAPQPAPRWLSPPQPVPLRSSRRPVQP